MRISIPVPPIIGLHHCRPTRVLYDEMSYHASGKAARFCGILRFVRAHDGRAAEPGAQAADHQPETPAMDARKGALNRAATSAKTAGEQAVRFGFACAKSPADMCQIARRATLALACTGLVLPNAAIGALARHGTRAGSASALLGVLQFGLAALGAALVGALTGADAVPMALLMLAGVGVALLADLLRPHR